MSSEAAVRLDFMSPEWLAMAERELRAAVAAHPGPAEFRLSLVERLRNRPARAPEADVLRIELAGGRVTLAQGDAARAADVEIDCDWADAHRAAALPIGPELDAFNRERVARGRLVVRGDPGPARALLAAAHDRIAARTLPPIAIGRVET